MAQIFNVGNLQSQIAVHKNQSQNPTTNFFWIMKDQAHVENTRERDKVRDSETEKPMNKKASSINTLLPCSRRNNHPEMEIMASPENLLNI